jgi:hypothetical protein
MFHRGRVFFFKYKKLVKLKIDLFQLFTLIANVDFPVLTDFINVIKSNLALL